MHMANTFAIIRVLFLRFCFTLVTSHSNGEVNSNVCHQEAQLLKTIKKLRSMPTQNSRPAVDSLKAMGSFHRASAPDCEGKVNGLTKRFDLVMGTARIKRRRNLREKIA